MSDEQQLRDALEDAVPEPPYVPGRAREARHLSRERRREAVLVGGLAVVALALAVPVVRSLTASDRHETLDITTRGTGSTACRELQHHDGLGYLVDTRIVDADMATDWSSALRGWPERTVTVCVLSRSHSLSYTVVATQAGYAPRVVTRGSYGDMAGMMTHLGELQEQQPATLTDAPFTCPPPGDDNLALPGSPTLPDGATAARICTDGDWYYPSQPLTSGVDGLVRAINSQPLTYSRGSTCAGIVGAHGYAMVFEYPGGTRTVEADTCGWIGVGSVQRREASPSVGDRFLSALAEQEGASGVTTPPTCPASASAPTGPGDLTHVVAARFCPAGVTGDGVLLSASQLKRLRTGTDRYDGSYTQIEGACREPARGWPHLMLSDAWHEQFSVTLRCAHLRFWEMRVGASSPTIVRPVLVFGVRGLLRELVHQAG